MQVENRVGQVRIPVQVAVLLPEVLTDAIRDVVTPNDAGVSGSGYPNRNIGVPSSARMIPWQSSTGSIMPISSAFHFLMNPTSSGVGIRMNPSPNARPRLSMNEWSGTQSP